MKYVVVTGGVISGLGKGITISSIGRILKACNLRVTAIKIDPYLNVDAGTMSPFEHGETYVLDDGGETDLDLGNYERFLDVTLTAKHNITSGKVYKEVIRRERRGDYLGKTVQMVPHVTDMVQSWLKEVAKIDVDGTGLSPDVCLVEVGGTVGDIESMVFLEALRQFQFVVGRENILFIHVSLVPTTGGEQKSKPTQHSVKELRALGLTPDVIVCRASEALNTATKNKISIFCHVPPTNIISNYDVSNIYHVPLILEAQGIHGIILRHLCLDTQTSISTTPSLGAWRDMASIADTFTTSVEIAIVGKYVTSGDSYLSLVVAIRHAALALRVDLPITWVEATDLEESTRLSTPEKYNTAWEVMRRVKGVIIPGGFGVRGVEGKVLAAQYCRTYKLPCLGICLGLQVMVIEYARHVLNLMHANSAEFDEGTPEAVVVFMPETATQSELGGTMRLGARDTHITLENNTLASVVYGLAESGQCPADVSEPSGQGPANTTKQALGQQGKSPGHMSGHTSGHNVSAGQGQGQGQGVVTERHRHRYEVNPAYVEALESAGLMFTGRDDTGQRMEIAELPTSEHPFYFAVQFHPELKSRPTRPSPPICAFAAAAAGRADALGMAGQLWQEHEVSVHEERFKVSQGNTPRRKRSASEALGSTSLFSSFSMATETSSAAAVLPSPVAKAMKPLGTPVKGSTL